MTSPDYSNKFAPLSAFATIIAYADFAALTDDRNVRNVYHGAVKLDGNGLHVSLRCDRHSFDENGHFNINRGETQILRYSLKKIRSSHAVVKKEARELIDEIVRLFSYENDASANLFAESALSILKSLATL